MGFRWLAHCLEKPRTAAHGGTLFFVALGGGVCDTENACMSTACSGAPRSLGEYVVCAEGHVVLGEPTTES